MSLNKAIEHGKEKRRAYSKENGSYAKSVDKSCRNNGGDPWSEGNRLHSSVRKEEAAKAELKNATGHLPESEED